MKRAVLVKAIRTASAQPQGGAAITSNQAPIRRNFRVTAAVLRQCLLFCSLYPQIRQTLSVEFPTHLNSGDTVPRIPATLSPEIAAITKSGTHESSPSIRQTVSAELPTPLVAIEQITFQLFIQRVESLSREFDEATPF
ncbi:MAG: hypothetical protein V4689_16615 [Verrucomicrobiota bacterium]